MRPLRVLVVDDSVVVRKMITEALGRDPGLVIAGVAANGQIALQKLEQVREQDSPAKLQQIMQGPPQKTKTTGKDW